MPVLTFTFDAGSITADMLPIEVGFGPIGPFGFGGTPSIPISIGSGTFDFGVKVIYSCPGFPLCGKDGEACSWNWQKVGQVDPISLVSLKIPGIPALPKKIGPFGGTWQIPPKPWQPFACAQYPRVQGET